MFELNRKVARRQALAAFCGMAALLSACSTIDPGKAPALDRKSSWVVFPFANYTETPLAGQRAQAIAQALLLSSGVGKVQRAPEGAHQEALFDAGDEARVNDALAWARKQNARYALSGSVQEWRYKVGVDGEPAVGVTLQFIDVASGDILWSGSGGKSGWSREALSAVANELMRELLAAGLSQTR